MRADERDERDADRPVVFAVAPVRGKHLLPRAVVVALAVGVLAFLAGIQVGSGGTADPPGPSEPPPTPSPAIAATPPPISDPPGSSAFVRSFQPADLITQLPGGAACVASSGQKEVPRSRRDGPRLTFIRHWMAFCPIQAERRQSFLLAVIDALVQRVPSETYAFSSGTGGSGDALFPYAEAPYVGSVTLSADAAGPGYEIVVTVEERLAQ
jgi:hypothetical protein